MTPKPKKKAIKKKPAKKKVVKKKASTQPPAKYHSRLRFAMTEESFSNVKRILDRTGGQR